MNAVFYDCILWGYNLSLKTHGTFRNSERGSEIRDLLRKEVSFLNVPPRRRFFAVEKTSSAPRYEDTHSSQIRWQHQGSTGSTMDVLFTLPISVKEPSIHKYNDGQDAKSAGSEKPRSPHKPIFDLGRLLFGIQ